MAYYSSQIFSCGYCAIGDTASGQLKTVMQELHQFIFILVHYPFTHHPVFAM